MLTEKLFARDEVAPSWWANALNRALSLMADALLITQVDATHLAIPAGADAAAAVCSIGGSWRWIEATLTRAHPGGAAGTFDLYLTAKATSIVNTPAANTDTTDYAFDFKILTHGSTPPIVAGTVDVFRLIGYCQWDGTQITRVDQIVPVIGNHKYRHATGGQDAITPADIGAASTVDLASAVSGLNAAINAAAVAAAQQAPQIGAQMPYSGSGDPVIGMWVVADGRLIDKTTFATFFARSGHTYNGGVDPGSNKVRIPDKRGRKSIGAIDFGTGAAANDNAHAQVARGASGGEVVHTLGTAEIPGHSHGLSQLFMPMDTVGYAGGATNTIFLGGGTRISGTEHFQPEPVSGTTDLGTGGNGSHNNLEPYQADVWIVRIA